jgi:hypothetical protein
MSEFLPTTDHSSDWRRDRLSPNQGSQGVARNGVRIETVKCSRLSCQVPPAASVGDVSRQVFG